MVLASPEVATMLESALRDPDQDLEALVDRAHQNASEKLRGKGLRAIMGPPDLMSTESFAAAVVLCNEAIRSAIRYRAVWDRRLASRTRSRLILSYANSHISGWARDRGMDLEEVQRLKVKGIVQ
jgi:hypothetical protein